MPPKPKAPTKPRVMYWFRTDLRLHDSPALQAALDLKPEVLYPIWTWDPHYVYHARVGPNRWQYLINCQQDLSSQITAVNPNSKLFVLREAPLTLLPKLWMEWKISHLVFEKDTDAYGRERDEGVLALAKKAGVDVVRVSGRTLWDSDDIVAANGGKPTMTLSQLQAAGKKLGNIKRPIPAPKTLPDPGDLSLGFAHEQPEQKPDVNGPHRDADEVSFHKVAGSKGDFAVPTLEELGIKVATTKHRGGETLALKTLDKILANVEYTATFEKPNTAPTAFEPQATTLLSAHLHFGSLSCREFYWRVQDVVDAYKKKGKKPSVPPTSLTGQLLFRDMYFAAQAKIGHVFSQAQHNAHCRFIPWSLPSTLSPTTSLATDDHQIDNPQAEEWFQRWKHGITGFPWIDALMRQLKKEGWIHHLGRHSVACFLTRGGCYIHWERGAEVFAEYLIDHETACNAGNWQWLSCSAFFHQFYRCYSPVAFPKKWDKQGAFVRRYVPELKNFSDKFIYEPWKTPVVDQKKWGCLIKGDGAEESVDGKMVYPKPMFDFDERRDFCLKKMKEAYGVGINGNDPKVLDGSWKILFGEEDGGVDVDIDEEDVALDDNEGAESGDEDGAASKSRNGKKVNVKPSDKGVRKRTVSKGQTTLDASVKRKKK